MSIICLANSEDPHVDATFHRGLVFAKTKPCIFCERFFLCVYVGGGGGGGDYNLTFLCFLRVTSIKRGKNIFDEID